MYQTLQLMLILKMLKVKLNLLVVLFAKMIIVTSIFLSKCAKYSDIKFKVDKLNNIGGCTWCGYVNHKTKDCKFRLKKRCTCGLWHFSFLCVEPVKRVNTKPIDLAPKDKKDTKNKVKVEPSANTIVISEAFSNFDSNSVFNCIINDLKIRFDLTLPIRISMNLKTFI